VKGSSGVEESRVQEFRSSKLKVENLREENPRGGFTTELAEGSRENGELGRRGGQGTRILVSRY
jgi:hypothetical protein